MHTPAPIALTADEQREAAMLAVNVQLNPAALERHALQTRARVLAARIIGGRA